jgi:hypothetical protein
MAERETTCPADRLLAAIEADLDAMDARRADVSSEEAAAVWIAAQGRLLERHSRVRAGDFSLEKPPF